MDKHRPCQHPEKFSAAARFFGIAGYLGFVKNPRSGA
jgi:hypothetical protein